VADFREILFAKAFKTGLASEYNQVAYAFRKQEEDPGTFYEVVLQDPHAWEYMRDMVYPNLVRYLTYKRMNPEIGQGLTVTLFVKDRFHLIKGPEFIGVYREMEGLDPAAFHIRVLGRLSISPN
jgi:hypothetical protein